MFSSLFAARLLGLNTQLAIFNKPTLPTESVLNTARPVWFPGRRTHHVAGLCEIIADNLSKAGWSLGCCPSD
jgi:hypothetical protein